jgi:hypothetical protein
MSVNSFFNLETAWRDLGADAVCQYCCLQIPKQDNGEWDIAYPEVKWAHNTVVIMHCQDFVNVTEDGCRELLMIEQHYGEYANRVVAVTWNIDLAAVYSGPINVVYFPYHSYEILENLSANVDQWRPNLQHPRTKRFQCLNGVAKKHRVVTVNLIKHYSNSIVTLDPDLQFDLLTYREHLSLTNEENFVRLSRPVYGDCDVNIVTESLYRHYPGIITEKSLFAWLSYQVPIIIGYPGIVAHARQLGFDTFDDIVDNSYDQYPNHTRAQAAITLNQKLLTDGIDRSQLQSRLEYNHHHALTWPARMRVSYSQQATDIYQRLTTGS